MVMRVAGEYNSNADGDRVRVVYGGRDVGCDVNNDSVMV